MQRQRQTDLDDYHDQPNSPAFSFGVARNTGGHTGKPKKRQVFNSASKTIDNTGSLTIVAASNKRIFLSIINNSAGVVWLGFGVQSDVSGTNGVKLLGNSAISFDSGIVPQNEVYAIAAGGQCNITVLEGNAQY